MARIVMTTWGSLGDLHPYMAVGIGLRKRGHDVTIVTFDLYRDKVEGEGLGFHKLGPDMAPLLDDQQVFRKAIDLRKGTRFLVNELIMPSLEEAYQDTLLAADGADLLVGHPVTYATQIVAEVLKTKWVAVVLQPTGLFSADDPPLYAAAPWLRSIRKLGRKPYKALLNLLMLQSVPWGRPVHRLRKKVGLPESKQNPILDVFSPWGTQAWFSEVFSPRQADWPSNTVVTGFPFYDRMQPGHSMSAELARFLENGDPPVVFTLGSSAVNDPGAFYVESLRAIQKLKRRAVFVVGVRDRSQLPPSLPDSVIVTDYAPHSELFPRALVNVHQGGIGTMAQALRSGRPMIVAPFAHDQPDNAMRAERLGVARVIQRNHYTSAALERTLTDIEKLAPKAFEVEQLIRNEDGTAQACDAIEAVLA